MTNKINRRNFLGITFGGLFAAVCVKAAPATVEANMSEYWLNRTVLLMDAEALDRQRKQGDVLVRGMQHRPGLVGDQRDEHIRRNAGIGREIGSKMGIR